MTGSWRKWANTGGFRRDAHLAWRVNTLSVTCDQLLSYQGWTWQEHLFTADDVFKMEKKTQPNNCGGTILR